MRRLAPSVIFFVVFTLAATSAFPGALVGTASWHVEGFLSQAQYGSSVAVADLNHDGYADVIVGGPFYSSSSVGAVKIYYGSATGLSTTERTTLTGSGEFGYRVAVLDYNGDGWPDVVVSAYQANNLGAVYVYFGSAAGISTSPGVTITSSTSSNMFQAFGSEVFSLGDVNHDGYGDLAIMCSSCSDGSAYIYYGGPGSLTHPAAVTRGGFAGMTVQFLYGVGDVNGDGYDDVIGRYTNGRVGLFLGSATGLPAVPNWWIDRPGGDAWLPAFGARDINHDGFADVAIATSTDPTYSSVTYAVYFGSASGLSTPAQTFTLPYYSTYAAGVGDVDGDGYADAIMGCVNCSHGQNLEGRAFLLRGSAGGLIPQAAWTGEANIAGAAYGSAIGGGDVNGDGLSDVVIGAYQLSNHGGAFLYNGTNAACSPPSAPSALAVTATVNNQLTLNWTGSTGSVDHYAIYRALSGCPIVPGVSINDTPGNVTTYVDTTAIAGAHYAYIVTAANAGNTCESSPTNCSEATSPGTCTTPPAFSGVQSVTQISCGFTLSWNGATNYCPGAPLRYNIYFAPNTTSFTPYPSTRIASCVAGNTFDAVGVGTGAFIVRAANADGNGGCVNEETNTKIVFQRSPIDWSDNIETATSSWLTNGAVRSTCHSWSSSNSYRVSHGSSCSSYDPFQSSSLTLAGNLNSNGFTFPASGAGLKLVFMHYYSTEAGHDGAMLQYSTTGVNGPFGQVLDTVQTTAPYILYGKYDTTINGFGSAWSGSSGGSFNQVTVVLDGLAGKTVWFRWLFTSDGSTSSEGYFVDDVSISGHPSGLTSVSLTTAGGTTVCIGGGSGGTATATPVGGAPWTFDWGYRTVSGGSITHISSGGSSIAINASNYPGPGAYLLVATVTGSCGTPLVSNEVPVTVFDVPAPPSVSASGASTFCAGGSVTLTAPAGFTYLWSNAATTQAITVSTAGSYTVRVSDANGCSAVSAANVVTVNPLPTPSITAGGPTTFCADASVTLTSSSGASYLWSDGATTQAITVSAGGNYSVTVTDANGCSGTSPSFVVTVNPLPTPAITAGGPTTFCAGGSVVLTSSPASLYLWSTGATTRAITATAAGDYSVRVTDANGCSATSAPQTVIVNALPVVAGASAPATVCWTGGGYVASVTSDGTGFVWTIGNGTITAGQGSSSITFNPDPAFAGGNLILSVVISNANGCSTVQGYSIPIIRPDTTVTASGPTTFCAGGSVTLTAAAASSYLWSDGETTQSIAVTAAGNYSVTVADANGCSATSTATMVTVNTNPTATIVAGGPTIFCAGGSVTLTASSASSYLWSTGETSPTITVSSNGSYAVTVTDANGCRATSTPTVVVANANPAATITAGGPTTFCAGDSVTLTASNGTSYLWSNGATTPSINVTASGNYSVTVTDDNACSATSDSTVVIVNALPAATITPGGPTTFCAGGSVTLTASSGASYLWSTGATTQSIAVNAAGAYNVIVTNASGCSATSAATAVTVNPNPTASITAGGPTTFCAGGSVTLTASSGALYLWSNGATTQSTTVNTNGNYAVIVTNAFGCSTTSAATAVTVNPLPATPSVTAGGPTTFCAGGSVTLTAPAGYTYTWSNGATTQSIATSASGSFSVTVTDGNGCSATSAPSVVTVNALPATPSISAGGPTTFCAGGSVTLTAPAGYTYAWSNGANTQAVTINNSGSYSVTVTDANGCSATSVATGVTVNTNPTAAITAGGPTTFCAGGSVTLTASSAASYLWSTGATTQAITVNAGGSYSVSVTNGSGCSTTSPPTAVTVNANPTATITAGGPTTFCAGGSVTLTASSGASYLWSTGPTTASITLSAAGNYSVTVTNANGCSATSTPTAVTVNANPTATITAGGPTTFVGSSRVDLQACKLEYSIVSPK